MEGNLDLKIAAARVREARAARGIAASAGLPQVDAGGAYSRAQRSEAVPPFKSAAGGSSPFGPREQNAFEAGFDASWEIDVFGGVRRDKEAALAQVQAAEEARRDVLVTLLADVARTYVELRATQRQLEILDEDRAVRAGHARAGEGAPRRRAGDRAGRGARRGPARLRTTAGARRWSGMARQAIYRLGVLLGKEPGALASELEAPGGDPPGASRGSG